MFGDWLWWSDQVNNTIRLVSPQGFAAGRLANLSPEQSSLNKQIYGVVGSQRTGTPGSSQNTTYSSADLSALLSAGIDLICNPQPGGSYWGIRGGLNTSSNAATNGDNYTRLTNYIAKTLAAGMGLVCGPGHQQYAVSEYKIDPTVIPEQYVRTGLAGKHQWLPSL